MSKLYETIVQLCAEKGVTITELCRKSGASRGSLTDLKMGRKSSLSAATLSKIAAYFGVSVDYLLGNEEKEMPTEPRPVSDEDIKFALFGDVGVSDEDFEDVKRFAAFIKNKKRE